VKMVRGRGNVDNAILDTLKQIIARLDVVEIAQRRGAHLDDVSDNEAVAPKEEEERNAFIDSSKYLHTCLVVRTSGLYPNTNTFTFKDPTTNSHFSVLLSNPLPKTFSNSKPKHSIYTYQNGLHIIPEHYIRGRLTQK
jgi:hypothetical protein